jgi:hypothetical protein
MLSIYKFGAYLVFFNLSYASLCPGVYMGSLFDLAQLVCSLVPFCVRNAKVVSSRLQVSKMCWTTDGVQSNVGTENQTFLTKV